MLKISLFLIVIFIFFIVPVNAQSGDKMREDAKKFMDQGKYGEAIEILNKYISAYPQKADGYNLRGLSFEQRNQLENAVFDFRVCIRLEPGNKEYATNLDRATKNWHEQLRRKIRGHQREIAINPNNPVNYVEIAHCHKLLGEWALSEEWYDKYVAIGDPSPDEVIRYCEVLSKTGSIVKGEQILLRYTKRFPDDWRLWARLGYFSYWLGKMPQAKDAFERSLAIKPYFKEAQDGLDLVLGKYVPDLFYDTLQVIEAKKNEQGVPEYAIDRYYRIVKLNPDDDNTRFLLAQELLKEGRIEEAYAQILILNNKFPDDQKISDLYVRIVERRESEYNNKIAGYVSELERNPDNKKALTELGILLGLLERYDEALGYYSDYFARNPDETDLDLRYAYAQLATNAQDYYVAIEQLDYCLDKQPDNLDYQLLRGLIELWLDNDSDLAYTYLKNVEASKPNVVEVLVGLASLEMKKNNFDETEIYINKIKAIDPFHPEIVALESNLVTWKLRYEEEQLFESLEIGREMIRAGQCDEALVIYDEFFTKHPGNRVIFKEYADIQTCLKNYDAAIDILNRLIEEEYDFLIDLERAKLYFWKGDYESAKNEFERLVAEDNADFSVKLFLGDSYAQLGDYDRARDIYDSLLIDNENLEEIGYIEQRIGWLPVAPGLFGFLSGFPQYMLLSPSFAYFEDNYNFRLLNYAFSVELGLINGVSVGATGVYGNLKSGSTTVEYNGLKANLYLTGFDYFTLGFSAGSQTFLTPNKSYPWYEAFLRAEKDSVFSAQVSYFDQDAAFILYSAALVYPFGAFADRLNAKLVKFEGWYNTPSYFRVSTAYSYIMVGDGNRGANFEVRLGRYFFTDLLAGYEYYSTIYARKSLYYFSPQDYTSHSLFVDWNFIHTEEFNIKTGGRVGLIPQNNYWLREIYGFVQYTPFKGLRFQLRGQIGNTVREEVGYSSRSLLFSIFYIPQ